MNGYSTLRELVKHDAQSRALFERCSPDAQVALQEQRQNIRTYEDLRAAAEAFARR